MSLNLLTLPSALATALNITTFAAGLVLTFLILMATFGVVTVLTRNAVTSIVASLLVVLAATALEWLPYWVVIMVVMVIAILWGDTTNKLLGG